MKFGKAFIIFLVLAIIVWGGICRPYSIPMGGMEPALYEGDNVLVLNRWCDRELRIGDFVLYNAFIIDSLGNNNSYEEQNVARIAALPGDTVCLNKSYMMLDESGKEVPFSRELYVYNSKYDDKIIRIINSRNWGHNELAGYEGYEFVRSLTAFEADFIKKAIPKDLNIHKLRKDSLYKLSRVILPQKGRPVDVTDFNKYLLLKALQHYEKCEAEIVDGKLYVNGKKAKRIVFSKDYCWLKSENVVDMYDSRNLGFVPMDDITGRITVVFFSKESKGKIRWSRFFEKVK